ncbi:MAG: hypothetical protein GC205_01125 [Bacteroidetes bacterium]|nr:hypothetical protein [Bacteroidota bacterium]
MSKLRYFYTLLNGRNMLPLFAVLALVLSSSEAAAQTQGILQAQVRHKDVQLEEGEIVSNILRITNPTDRTRSFSVSTTEPAGWRRLSPRDLLYTLSPGDSMFVPVRLIPSKEAAGASVVINVLVMTDEGQQVAQDFFFAQSEKRVIWNLEVEEGRKIYFPSGQNQLDIHALLENQGAYDQDIFVRASGIGQGLVIESKEASEDQANVVKLSPGADTSLTWTVRTEQSERNLRSVSVLSHRPDLNLQGRHYSMLIETTEPLQSDSLGYRRATRVELLELPNDIKVQEHSSQVLPLIVEGQYQNIMGQQSVFALNLNGTMPVNDQAYLVYFSQLMFREVYASNPLTGAPWYIGYFDPKYTVEAGTINGAMLGMNSAGRGLKTSWQVNPGNRLGAFYVRGPFIQNPFHQSFGLSHQLKLGKVGMLTTRAGRNMSTLLDQATNVGSATLSLRLAGNQSIGLTGAYSLRETNFSPDSSATRQGFLAGLNYSSHYLDRRLAIMAGAQTNSRYFGSANLQRIAGNSRITYLLNPKWDIYYAGAYNRNYVYSNTVGTDTTVSENEQSINNLVFSTRTGAGSIQPGAYYNVLNRPDFVTHSRGLSFRYSAMEFNKNFMFTLFAMGGYDDPRNLPGVKDYFTFRFNTLMRIRTLTLTSSYQYGALSSSSLNYQLDRGTTPQFFRISANHQYVFQNRRYVMENSGFYTYNNQFRSHTLGTYPRIYYFSNTGWRFEVQFGYTLSSNNFESTFDTYTGPLAAPVGGEGSGAVVNNNVSFGVGLRKEFGIPIPFAKKKAATAALVAFYDLNGNGYRDEEEQPISDVVIGLGNYEVMTNLQGQAAIRNLNIGTYRLTVTPLTRQEGWFPNLPDSINIGFSEIQYIPFVRGVKVTGNVYVNRQQIAVTDDKQLDLTNIKITATSKDGERDFHTLTDLEGNFSFYLPNGTYRLSMDESILGSRFRLAQNNLEITLKSGIESMYTSFYITEKEREVKVKRFESEVPVIRPNND